MIDAELKTSFNAILTGAAELEETELDLERQVARIQLGLYPQERGFDREPEMRRLALSGLKAVMCWTGNEILPPELRFEDSASPGFMRFVASLFRNQWIFDWDLFAESGDLLKVTPAWGWIADQDWQLADVLFLELERANKVTWKMGLWFSGLELETPLETRQSLKEFVNGWRFMALSQD